MCPSGGTRSPGTSARTTRCTTAGTGLTYAFEHSAYGSTTLVTAVHATTGRTAWQRRLDGMLTPVGTSDGALVMTAMNGDAQTVGLVRYEPEERNVVRMALPFRMNEPEIVLGGDTAYLLAHGGTLVAVDTRPAEGGKTMRWQPETGAGRTSAPVLATGNRLYFSAADGRLMAVDTEHGKLLGQTSPRLRNGRLTYSSALPAPVAMRPDRLRDRARRVRVRRGRTGPRSLVRAGGVLVGQRTDQPGSDTSQPSLDTSRTAPRSALVAIAAYARSAAETLRSRSFGA